MKAYILTEEDFEKLKEKLKVDPQKATVGINGEHDLRIFGEAHRFYNYIICRWIDTVKE